MHRLMEAFADFQMLGRNQLRFYEREQNLYEVFQFVAANQIPLLKMERMEPSLETLFMEVVEK